MKQAFQNLVEMCITQGLGPTAAYILSVLIIFLIVVIAVAVYLILFWLLKKLTLDSFYGLKEQHDISDFGTLFWETDLYEGLMSENPQIAGQAISDLCYMHLDDIHSGYDGRSWMMEEEPEIKKGPSAERLYLSSESIIARNLFLSSEFCMNSIACPRPEENLVKSVISSGVIRLSL